MAAMPDSTPDEKLDIRETQGTASRSSSTAAATASSVLTASMKEEKQQPPPPSSSGPPRSGTRRTSSSSRSSSSASSDPFSALERALTPNLSTPAERIRTAASATTTGSGAARPPDREVVFAADGADDPRRWPLWYRAWTIFAVSFSTWLVVLYSTSYTASMPGLMAEFHEPNPAVATLGVTTYLLGLAVGSLVVAPMSELYGRRAVYIVCLVLFTLLVIPCALATSMTEILVVRFFGALFGSAMVSNSPGTIVDISTEEYRALCMSLWSIAPLNGPVTGPLIGGFVYQYLGWRWDNWLVMIVGGASVLMMLTVKETYAPAILQAKAARLRKETGDDSWWSRYDQKVSTLSLLKVNLSRPFVLSFTEPILWFFNIWISVIYGILYLCFVAYPIIFVQYRGWSPGISGLAFVGIGIGSMMAILSEPLLRRLINSHPRDPETGRVPPEASASVMTIGAVLTPIGQLVFSWTSLPVTRHWAVPIAFGIPFGCGNTLSFIYGANYLAGSYGIYAASALAGNAVMRSIFGGTLPLAGPAMYAALTPQWAGTLLGLLEVCLIPIPFVFYRYGAKIRGKSRVIRQMREDQARDEARAARQRRRQQQRQEEEGEDEKEVAAVGKDGGSVVTRPSGASRLVADEEKGGGLAVRERDSSLADVSREVEVSTVKDETAI